MLTRKDRERPLARSLRLYCRTEGLTVSELARHLDLPDATVRQWTLGVREPSLEMLGQVARKLGLDLNDILK